MDSKKRAIGFSLAALLVLSVATAMLTGGGGSETPPSTADDTDTSLTAAAPTPAPGIIDTPAPPQDVNATPRVSTSAGSSGAKAPSAPSAPIATPTDPATPPSQPKPSPGPDPWDEYAAETGRIVQENKTELGEVAAAIVSAFKSSDAPTLGSLLAPDEGSQDEYVAGLAERYPAIMQAELGANVNVFAQGQATIYIAYAVVTWTDAGITSTHTIPIPMRYVDGQWHLSCLTDTDGELVFVQSVNL